MKELQEIIESIEDLQEQKIELLENFIYTITPLLEMNNIEEIKNILKATRSIYVQTILDKMKHIRELNKIQSN